MKLKLTIVLIGILSGKILSAQTETDITAYVNAYKDIAISEMQRAGIPASIILAQGIHETQAGTSDLVKKSNNHFGIKCKDTWTGAVVYHDDDRRGECFRSYNSPLDSYRDHSDFLKNSARYGFLFQIDPLDYESWAYGLKKAGYATNPKYPQILIQLIRDYNLQQYTLIAMGKIKPADDMAAGRVANPNSSGVSDQQKQGDVDKKMAVSPQYPSGEFTINNTRVVFAKAGTALLSLSEQYDISLSRLMDFNDIKNEDVLIKDQLIFLQRKRKKGATEFHIVQPGETIYDICQAEGIRNESLLTLNLLSNGEEPAPGEKINLQSPAAAKPALNDERIKQAGPTNQNPVNIDTKEKNAAAIPTGNAVTHVVQNKETLYSISKKYGVDVEQIQKWNKLDSLNLKKGQELIIYKN
jgi:LysM repeat protein